MAPAKLVDGRLVDLWRNTEQVSWEVPRGAAPASRGGRWRSWPYLAERAPAGDTVFWGALSSVSCLQNTFYGITVLLMYTHGHPKGGGVGHRPTGRCIDFILLTGLSRFALTVFKSASLLRRRAK